MTSRKTDGTLKIQLRGLLTCYQIVAKCDQIRQPFTYLRLGQTYRKIILVSPLASPRNHSTRRIGAWIDAAGTARHDQGVVTSLGTLGTLKIASQFHNPARLLVHFWYNTR
jgi:hypothetical protein